MLDWIRNSESSHDLVSILFPDEINPINTLVLIINNPWLWDVIHLVYKGIYVLIQIWTFAINYQLGFQN
jgi:hypothetical protein